MKRRLYLQLYAALLVSAFLCLVAAAVAFRLLRDTGGPPGERLRRAAVSLPDALPDPRAPDARARLERWAAARGVDVIVGDENGPFLGVPSPRAFPVPRHGWGGGPRRERGAPVVVVPLESDGDGSVWAALRPHGPYRPLRVHPFFATLVILAVVMAVGSYPVARWVTRRLDALARTVDGWGRGDLAVRAAVSGDDEVATLARTFNAAAERLDLLLAQQRQMLANASHELRSPLARLRMGLELIADEDDAARRRTLVEQIHRDIVELDGLIEEVLLFSRADLRVPARPPQPVDMRALVQEEAARTGARLRREPHGRDDGPAIVPGDATMLRHLTRNLLENAKVHGGSGPVDVILTDTGTALILAVEDEGPGVPPEEQERIFAPFYRRAPSGGVVQPPGHGLGLALVRQVARYHGGDVVYRARAAAGSRFEVTLPLGSASPGAPVRPLS